MNTLKMLVGSAALLVASIACAGPPQTFLSMRSDVGDVVGQGRAYYLPAPAAGHLVINTSANHSDLSFWLDTSFSQAQPLPPWTGDFGTAGRSAPLAIGQYDNAISPATANSPYPGLNISYGSIHPSSAIGSFHIYDLGFDIYGNVDHLAMTFEQYANGTAAALHGMLWYNSDMALPAVPEPATYAQLAAGLGLLGIGLRRRKASA